MVSARFPIITAINLVKKMKFALSVCRDILFLMLQEPVSLINAMAADYS